MKIYPWLDCTAVAVVGTRYALGEGNEVLDQWNQMLHGY